MSDLAHALETVLADIERGSSVDDALARQAGLEAELAPLVALALSARAQPALSSATRSAQASLLVAEAARLFPPGGPADGPSDGGAGPAAPSGPGQPSGPLGPMLMGVAAALLLTAVLTGVATLPRAVTPAPSGAAPGPEPTLVSSPRGGAKEPTSAPGATRTEPSTPTGTPVRPTPSASPSPTASRSPTPAGTITVAPRAGQVREPAGPAGSATPSPTATESGYPAPTTTQVFAPTATPAPYP